MVDPATGTRIGPVVKNFGWLRPNYEFDGCVEPNCMFWRRTATVTSSSGPAGVES